MVCSFLFVGDRRSAQHHAGLAVDGEHRALQGGLTGAGNGCDRLKGSVRRLSQIHLAGAVGGVVQHRHRFALMGGQEAARLGGIGNIGELLKRYHAKGGRDLTLEPHLKAFSVIKDLEQDFDEGQLKQEIYATEREAFDVAVNALNNLIKEV